MLRAWLGACLVGAAAAGTGLMATPGLGQYCSNYFPGGTVNIPLYVPSSVCSLSLDYNCNNSACSPACGVDYVSGWAGGSLCCPWAPGPSCTIYRVYDDGKTKNELACSPGCVEIANCTGLPAGANWTNQGGIGPSACSSTAPLSCQAGSYIYGTSCATCPPGSFCLGEKNSSQPCPPGTYAPSTGLSACLNCPTGTFQVSSGRSVCTGAAVNVGQYCAQYQPYLADYVYVGPIRILEFCAPGRWYCQWPHQEGCTDNWFRIVNWQQQISFNCLAGCVSSLPCTPVANARFTGSAMPITNASGCPFVCNDGYMLFNNTCVTRPPVPTCPQGQYYTGTACAACPACGGGLYSMGCGGSSQGTCASCVA